MPDTSDGTVETGHFKCPCASCILTEARKYEDKKQYKEVDLVIKNGLRYYSSMIKQLEEESKKFHARTKYNASNSTVPTDVAGSSSRRQETIQFTHCQHAALQTVTKIKEFTCPVAMFEQNPDPKQKPMYPKNLVYLDGSDHQLEEIRAARYLKKSQAKNSLQLQQVPDNLKKILLSEEFIPFIEEGESSAGESSAGEVGKDPVDITNVVERVHSTVAKLKLLRGPTETENINPNAPTIMENVKNAIESETKITPAKRTVSTGFNKSPKNTVNHPLTVLNNEGGVFSSPARNRASREEAQTLPSKNQTFCLKDREKADTPRRIVETCLTNSGLTIPGTVISNESTQGNSSEEVPLKSRVSASITFVNSKTEENKDDLDKPRSAIQSNEQATALAARQFTRERSKIPTIKISVPQTEPKIPDQKAAGAEAVCSKTFIVAKSNPSDTYVLKANDDITDEGNPAETFFINKVSLTLVQDFDDDIDPFPLRRRTSRFFRPSDVETDPAASLPSSSRRQSIKSDLDCTATEAFHIPIPCSTPNKRMTLFFKPSDIDSDESAPQANLSTITEMSKENYNNSSRPSQKTPLETIKETERSSESSKDDSVEIIPDPFDTDLIQRLLEKIQFPRPEHLDGYNRINCDMAQMKLSSVVKLGNNKYNIIGEIGKGSYARILKLQDVKESGQAVALKQQKPACPWEFYISKEIQRRLRTDLERSYFIEYGEIFVYRNGSVMLSPWAPYGSILALVNNLKKSPYHNNRCPMAVAVRLSVQLVEIIQFLHKCNIIHGDVKPDNFVLCDEIATDRACIKLIDYGRSIDMSLLPKNVIFTKVVTTEDHTCHEMKDNRPWTYQTDIFGLASTIYLLLVGEYMKTKKENEKWVLQRNFPRYINRDLWNSIFDRLLNIPSCTELPDLDAIRQTLEADFNSMDRQTITQQFANIGTLLKN